MILQKIQSALKAPKNQFNAFGEYRYRSLEDIMEALKPLLAEHEAALILTDDIVLIGARYYVKATASLTTKDGVVASATAYARETETKKKMDDSQITGSASSYARKYAMNGLFAIDDTKDADASNKHEDVASCPASPPAEFITADQAATINDKVRATGSDSEKFLKYMNAETVDTILTKDYQKAISALNAKKEAAHAPVQS